VILKMLGKTVLRIVSAIRETLGQRCVELAVCGVLGFALAYLPQMMTDPYGPYHGMLGYELSRALEPGRRLIGALPREHAKTTLGTVALVLRELCLGGKRNILLVAANRAEAEGKLRQIVHEIETNPHLPQEWRARLAPARDQKGHNVAYGDAEIVLAGGARISTIGFGGRVRGQLEQGRRLDLVVLDDPEDDVTVESAELRHRLARWVDHALLNALDVERGSLVWLGTLLHHDSVLAQWLKRHGDGKAVASSGWHTMKLGALSDQGIPLWPGRWSRERLDLRAREIGETAFAQEYMNRPVSLSGQVFREGDFRTYDPAALSFDGSSWLAGREPLNIAIGVDPAIGQGDRHDYFAACVVGIAGDSVKQVYVLEVLRIRQRFAEQLDSLLALASRWRPRLVAVENTAYQAALTQAAWEAGLPVKGMVEQRPKAVRIEAAAVPAAQGRVHLPVAAHWVAGFREEALDYPAGRHDDQLDAFARALEAALSLGSGGMIECATAKRGDGLQEGFSTGHKDWQKQY
jgi:predicted phage terminase large subunit-like protein